MKNIYEQRARNNLRLADQEREFEEGGGKDMKEEGRDGIPEKRGEMRGHMREDREEVGGERGGGDRG
jgi:hypothetical protein